MKMDRIYLKKCLILFFFSFSFSLNIYAELSDIEVKSLIQQFAITDKSDENYRDREEIVNDLAESKNPKTVDFLIEALYDDNTSIKYGAITALKKLRDPRSIKPLGKLLLDEEYSHDDWLMRRILETLQSIKNPRVIENIIKSLKSEDENIQSKAIEILGSEKAEQAIKPLLFIAGDTMTTKELRIKAIKALGEIGDSIVANPLIEVLEEKLASEIRSAIVRTLCIFSNKKMAPMLIKELKTGNRFTKSIAAKELGEIGDTSAVMHLIDLINDKDARFSATEALGKIGDKRAVKPLISILETKPPCSTYTAIKALGEIGDTSSINALADIYTDTNLAKSSISVVLFLNSTAASALAQTNSIRAARILIEGFEQIKGNTMIDYNDIRRLLREITPTSVDILVKILRTENIKYKDWASEALARLGSKSVDSLLVTLTNENPDVRGYSVRALKEIGDPKAIVPLMKALRQEQKDKVRREISKALGCLGYSNKTAVDSLLTLLKDKDCILRREAAFALMITKEERAIEPLTLALKDNDFGVRIVAAWALTKIRVNTKTLIKALKNECTVVRWIAAYEIGERKNSNAIGALIECMKEEPKNDEEEIEKILEDLNLDFYYQDDYCSPSHIHSRFCSYARMFKLKEEHKDGQFAACCVLGELKAKEAVKLLIKALKHEKDYIREAAVWSLGEIKDKRATKPLIEALTDSNKMVRLYASSALRDIDDEKTVELLISLLKDERAEVRKKAIEVLQWIEDSRILEPLKSALKDENSEVQAAATRALVYKGEISFVTQFLEKDKEENKEIKDETTLPLEFIKESRSIEDLVNLLGAKNSRVRSKAFSALKDFDKMEVIKFLIIALVEHNETGRETAFYLLNDLGLNTYKSFISEDFRDYLLNIKLTSKKMSVDEKCGYILMEAATGEKEKVRENALEVIKRLNNSAVNKNFVEFLISRLKDDSPEVRSAIAYVLGESRNPKAAGPLIGLLKDEDKSVRRSAVIALGKIKDKSAIPALIEASNNENGCLIFEITNALANYGTYVVDVLIGELNNKSRLVRLCAASTLGHLEDKRAVKPLIETLNDESYMVVDAAICSLARIGDKSATEPLLLLLNKENPDLQRTVVRALRKIKDPKAVEPLIELLESTSDPNIYKLLARTLGELNDSRAVKPLINLLNKEKNTDTRKAVIYALGKIKDTEAVEPLIKLLDDNDRDVQWASVYALGEVGDVIALKALKTFMKDKDERMKKRTEEAIAKIKKRISVKNYNF